MSVNCFSFADFISFSDLNSFLTGEQGNSNMGQELLKYEFCYKKQHSDFSLSHSLCQVLLIVK